jgi:hypothetical protein
MINYKSILVLGLIVLQTTVAHADWSFTKLLTINHYGSPSENDGFRPESFLFEKKLDDTHYYSIGVIENSEERTGIVVGYSTIFYQYDKFNVTRNIYLSSNYKKLPFITPIPTLGVHYQLTPKTNARIEAVPVPSSNPYILFISSVNINF